MPPTPLNKTVSSRQCSKCFEFTALHFAKRVSKFFRFAKNGNSEGFKHPTPTPTFFHISSAQAGHRKQAHNNHSC